MKNTHEAGRPKRSSPLVRQVKVSKRAFLDSFPDVVRALKRYVSLDEAQAEVLISIERAAAAEAEKMKADDKRVAAAAAAWEVRYRLGKAEHLADVHRKTRFTDWTPRAPGSAFKPK
ncbi:hypothetical protein [Aromatoleum bremense]|uniref:Uncharacterized protein n=1 Tax=Aromatoleum bremense TaxID=76115 RepID=A0ABX1NY21_9RHOO|nr:hypothetical protein [Aromatoleum bremense]NMG16748.1 hypothetical protein [Aromatoleum bremense]QTQ33020.1 Uncharacterized protein pbN1_30320 [Aromatoleum bremense]